MSDSSRIPPSQAGVILVVGMIVLLVMTLIGLSAARSTLLDHNVAFQAAEAALRAGEQSLCAPALPDFNDTGGRFRAREYVDPSQPPYWKEWQGGSESSRWAGNAIAYDGFSTAPAPLNQASARYYIEEFPLISGPGESLAADTPVDELRFYRVTARGVGISETTSAILQSTYKR
jgi:type IV pilus assembly protein PilX